MVVYGYLLSRLNQTGKLSKLSNAFLGNLLAAVVKQFFGVTGKDIAWLVLREDDVVIFYVNLKGVPFTDI